ncbi:OmpA family protein [Kiloniella laminariae]|uniref:OmpA family protein n=1 Tax=Kiloniella laminariae TaxID=454162 RepID=UPI0003821DC3|nr:OmpA family protein [Kiloniella laminariae]
MKIKTTALITATVSFLFAHPAFASPVDCSQPVDKAALVKKVVYFGVGKSGLSTEAKQQLDQLFEVIDGHPSLKICAVGQADKQGNPAANEKLSLKRAESVKSYLTKKGIAKKRIDTVFRGEAYGSASFWSETEDQAQDRRVEVSAYGE